MKPALLRPARPDDAPAVHRLVRELAEFERLLAECVSTVADFRRGLEEGEFEALLVESPSGEAVGFALYFPTYSTFEGRPGLWLEDLYVSPAWRGQGIAGRLLERLRGIGRERGCARLEWAVLDWNERAIAFYERIGARPVAGWTRYRLSLDPPSPGGPG